MTAKLKIAQLQWPVLADKAQTRQRLEAAVAEPASAGADLIALPEMFCCPYQIDNFPLYAEEEGGPMWQACSNLAAKYNIYFSAGSMPEKDSAGLIYNTAYVFDRSGRQIARHRKAHLFDIDVKGGQRFQESATLSPGDRITTFKTEFGVIGLCICYDFRFPEVGRLMALKGAQVVLVPAAFNMTTGPAHWEIMFRSQALNNQFFAVGTAPARDEKASYTSWGHSLVADPWGTVINQLDEKEGRMVTVLDLNRAREVREQLPLLRHRRTDIYTLKNRGE